LNAVFVKYVKFLVERKFIETSMAEKILKYSINLLDSFNDVRNNKTFAHDNTILGYDEALLIFNNIATSVRFIKAIEQKIKAKA